MKKLFCVMVLAFCAFAAFGQAKPIVVIAPFTASGGPSTEEAEAVTELLTSQIASLNRLTVVDRGNRDAVTREMQFQVGRWADDTAAATVGKALKARYVIRGQLIRLGDQYFLSATMLDIERLEIVASTNTQFSNLGNILQILPAFTQKLAEGIAPAPKGPSSPLIGTWQSTYSDIACIIEFMEDGKLQIYQYGYFTDRTRGSINTDSAYGTGYYSLNGTTLSITLQFSAQTLGTIRYNGSVRFTNGNNEFVLGGWKGLDWGDVGGHSTEGYKLFIRSN
jgi:TolB-like protein